MNNEHFFTTFSQTFGVITTRIDIQDSTGLNPARPSASTMAQQSFVSSIPRVHGTKCSNTGNPAPEYGQEVEVHNVLIIDQHTFEVLYAYQLLPQEYGMSIMSCQLGNDPNTYYVVGECIFNSN